MEKRRIRENKNEKPKTKLNEFNQFNWGTIWSSMQWVINDFVKLMSLLLFDHLSQVDIICLKSFKITRDRKIGWIDTSSTLCLLSKIMIFHNSYFVDDGRRVAVIFIRFLFHFLFLSICCNVIEAVYLTVHIMFFFLFVDCRA